MCILECPLGLNVGNVETVPANFFLSELNITHVQFYAPTTTPSLSDGALKSEICVFSMIVLFLSINIFVFFIFIVKKSK